MEGNDTQPSTRPEHVHQFIQTPLQNLQLPVALNAQGLEGLPGGMPVPAHFGRDCGPDNFVQGKGGLNRPLRPGPDNIPGDTFGALVLPVIPNQTVQLTLRILVHNLPGRQSLPSVHAHVQGSVKPVGKPSLPVVKLIGRDSQIQKDAVHFLHTLLLQSPPHIAVILPDHGHKIPKWGQPGSRRRNRIPVLVNSIEMPGSKPPAHLTGMSSAPQGAVHIYSIRLHLQRLHRLLQKHGAVPEIKGPVLSRHFCPSCAGS